MWPAATFLQYVLTVKITQLFRQLFLPFTIIFRLPARERAHFMGNKMLKAHFLYNPEVTYCVHERLISDLIMS